MTQQVVTIEGSRITPSVALAAGERRTVLLDKYTQNLIKNGFVTVVHYGGGQLPPEAPLSPSAYPPPGDHTSVTEDDPSSVTPLPTGHFAPADEADDEDPGPPAVPSGNASKAQWVDFLDTLGISYDLKATRDQLAQLWHERTTAAMVDQEQQVGG